MKKNNRLFFILTASLYILIALYIFRNFLWQDGIVGYRHDGGYFYYNLSYFKDFFASIWRGQGLGQFDIYSGSSFLTRLAIYLLSLTGIGSVLFSKIFAIAIFFGAGFGFFLLARYWKINPYAAVLSGLFYGFNPVTFNNFIAGYNWYLLAYALTPIILLLFEKSIYSKTKSDYWKYILLCGLAFAFAASQIHFVIILGVLLIFRIVIGDIKAWQIIKTIAWLYLILFIINSPWLISSFTTSAGFISSSAGSATVEAWDKIMSPVIRNALNLTAFYENRYFLAYVEGHKSWIIASTAIVIISFLALIIRRSRKIAYLALIGLIGFFLTKGLNAPLEKLSEVIYKFPGYASIFRQSYHWIALGAFAMTGLLAFSLNTILTKIKNKYYIIGIIIFFLIIFGFYNQPFFNNSLNKEVDVFKPNQIYDQLYQNECVNNSQNYRLMWLPAIGPVRQIDFSHSINYDLFIDNFCKKSFSSEGGILFFGGNSTTVRNFLIYSLVNNLSINNLGKTLGLVNIEKIINRADYSSEYPNISNLGDYPNLSKKWQENYIDLEHQTGIKKLSQNDSFSIYKNLFNKPIIYATNQPLVTSQNLSVITSDLVNNTDLLFFADQLIGAGIPPNSQNEISDDNLIAAIENKPILVLNPGEYATKYFNAKDGWINGQNWFWYNNVFAGELNKFALTLKPDEMNINLKDKIKPGSYTLLVKCLALNNDAKITLQIGNNDLDLKLSPSEMFLWKKYDLDLKENINQTKIVSSTGDVAIAKILIMSKNQKIKVLDKNGCSACINKNLPNLNYEKINPTKYKITVQSQNPFYLIFSENYNDGWKLFNEVGKEISAPHYIANGYANAFYIDNTGNQTLYLEFTPQKTYIILLYFSIGFCIFLIGSVIYLSLCKH